MAVQLLYTASLLNFDDKEYKKLKKEVYDQAISEIEEQKGEEKIIAMDPLRNGTGLIGLVVTTEKNIFKVSCSRIMIPSVSNKYGFYTDALQKSVHEDGCTCVIS